MDNPTPIIHSERPRLSPIEKRLSCLGLQWSEAIDDHRRGALTTAELDQAKAKIEDKLKASFYEWVQTRFPNETPTP